MIIILLIILFAQYSAQKYIIKQKQEGINIINNEHNFFKVFRHCSKYTLSYQTFEILNNKSIILKRSNNNYISITIPQTNIKNVSYIKSISKKLQENINSKFTASNSACNIRVNENFELLNDYNDFNLVELIQTNDMLYFVSEITLQIKLFKSRIFLNPFKPNKKIKYENFLFCDKNYVYIDYSLFRKRKYYVCDSNFSRYYITKKVIINYLDIIYKMEQLF